MPDFMPFAVVVRESLTGLARQALVGFVREGVAAGPLVEAGMRRYLAESEHDDGFAWKDIAKVPETYWIAAGAFNVALADVVVMEGTIWLQDPEERILPTAPPARREVIGPDATVSVSADDPDLVAAAELALSTLNLIAAQIGSITQGTAMDTLAARRALTSALRGKAGT